MRRYPTYKRVTSAITLILAAIWFGYVLLWPNTNATAGSGVPVGGPAPDFELKTVEGETYRLSDLKGKAVMLNFFATWCTYCKAEMPVLQEAYEKYRDQGFLILAIDLDESDLAITTFRDQYGLTFPIVVDRGSNVSQRYQIVPLPTSYFVDRSGIVRAKWTGAIDKAQMEALLKQIL
ncbi:peroxiredoxin [Symbiobacterium terraclitae]|uniref:Peroxiredoxin n=1 Tax=Symbiobacterium terraclitae TaxID=557451 RepID=A0ABS4JYW2_9FIRM|nr:redoxin domain-containing protein [Symbiobacterium terraclitae]MBP2020175.1 peroxiredoxin [Symbiobacterium terraclitae]